MNVHPIIQPILSIFTLLSWSKVSTGNHSLTAAVKLADTKPTASKQWKQNL